MPQEVKPAPRLRLRVSAAAERALRGGHPWLYANRVQEQNRPGVAGEIAVVYDRSDKFLAAGLFDPDSPICLRVLQVGKPQMIDADWWAMRLEQAMKRRESQFDDETNGFRWINGESDGWPGLVLDVYASSLVLKLYSAAWLPRLGEIRDLIHRRLHPERIVLRLSRNIQDTAREKHSHTDGELLLGQIPEGPVIFRESSLRFEADVLRGQKTGFFLDQRENRRRVQALAKGRPVLNAFSFSGAFSVYAAAGGAQAVTDLDISAHALASGERNYALNVAVPALAACLRRSVQADAFEWLEGAEARSFGLVILDPPSLAKQEAERERAVGAYERLARAGIRLLSADGVLVACSCSAHVTEAEFFEAVRRAARKSGRRISEIQTTGHAPDHPATFKEAQYLKAIYLSVDEVGRPPA